MKTYLVLDMSNLLHRTFFAGYNMTKSTDSTASGLALHSAFQTLNKYFTKFNPTKTICVFDRPNWRKDYTKSELCLSGKLYKGTRRQDMTPNEEKRYQEFLQHAEEFEAIVREHTSMVCMAADMLEADDIMAGFAEQYQDDRVIVISADKDLIQLLKFPNVSLIDPINDKERTCDDVEWFMFLKCIRGDRGDNVASAYPKVREVAVRKAFDDEFERLALMDKRFTMIRNEEPVEFRVGDLFKENQLLMDLYSQPEPVKRLIKSTIKKSMTNTGKYSHFHFIKFCGKHDLKRISENVDRYIKMLSR